MMENVRSLPFVWILLVVLSTIPTRVTHAQGVDPCRDCIVLQNIYNADMYTCDSDVVNAINRDCFETMIFETTRWYVRFKIVRNLTPEYDPDCTCSAFRMEFSPCGSSYGYLKADFWDMVPPCSATSWVVTLKGKRAFQQLGCADGRWFLRTLDECPAEIEIALQYVLALRDAAPLGYPFSQVSRITSAG